MFGVPLRIHSDLGRNVASAVIRKLCTMYVRHQEVPHQSLPPRWEWSGGAVQPYDARLLRVLPAEKKKWADQYLKEVVHAYNVTPHGSTGYLPHYVMFGRDSRRVTGRRGVVL